MEGISRFVVKRRKMVVMLTLLLTVVFTVCFFNVKINYNMTDYLPENANSTKALDLMDEEFGEAVPNCNVMAENVSIVKALEIKAQLEDMEGISHVSWLDDAVDLKQPLEVQDQDMVDDYYVDGNALFSVTIEDGQERAVTDLIKEKLGKGMKLSGSAVEQADSQRLAAAETMRAIMVIAPLIILILMISTTSWLEPFIYLTTIGAAALINLGSEIFRGEISYVTLAVAPLLQLAVSLDYAVFLSSAYEKHKRKAPNNAIAMVWAVKESFKSILASALTTIVSFLALTAMEFKIGPDMGISLVKGVVLSFIACMTFLPAAILLLNDLIEKTRHRKFMPSFKGAGKIAVKIRIPAFIIVLLVSGVCYIGQANNTFTYGSGDAAGSTEDAAAIKEQFGESNVMVLLVPNTSRTKEMLLSSRIEEMDHVTNVISYSTQVGVAIPPEYLSEEIRENFYGRHYARIIIYSDLPDEGKESFALVKNVRKQAAEYYGDDVFSCGQSANLYDMKNTVEGDNRVVNILTMVAIYLVLLFTMKSWLIPILLMLVIKCAIWVNMSIPFFTDSSLIYLGYLVVSTVQMGATIDYAILLTDKYILNRQRMGQKPAMEKTLGEVIPTILVSSSVLAIAGFALAFASSNAMVADLGVLIGRGALIPLVLVNLCLPAMLFFADKLLPLTIYRADFYEEPVASQRLLDEFDLDIYYDGKTKTKKQNENDVKEVSEEVQVKNSLLGTVETESYSDTDDSAGM